MVLFFAIILTLTSVLSWWISGFDPKLTGDNREDLTRRILRCGLTLFLMAAGLVEAVAHPRFAGLIALALAIPIVPLWMNCVGEAMSQSFYRLIDSPSDPSGAAPKELAADLDRLAELSNRGQINEALQLCAALLNKGDASRLALETMCFHLYNQMLAQESLKSSPSLSPIYQLCEAGRFIEAESHLTQILQREPENLFAVFLLLRLYVQNLRQPEKARALINSLEQRPNMPPMFADYIHSQIKEWASIGIKSDEGIESLLVRKRIPQRIGTPTIG
jgi:tetratricopeptide (TPR) repeat protein